MSKKNSATAIPKPSPRPKKRSIIGFLFKWILILLVLAGLGAAGFLVGGYYHLSQGLPKIARLADYTPPIISTVYADDSHKIAEFFDERRIVTPLDQMPEMLLNAFVAAEDARFYKHKGIDLISILRAFIKNVEAGHIVQGGSTITQQVTKSFFLTPERSYERKIKEAILAYRIDKSFSKRDILYLYLNQIYLGHGAYGVAAAAENYFGKSVRNLSLAECAMLAGLPQAPSKYSPFRHPERARERQIYVLGRMAAEGYITPAQAEAAKRIELDIKPRRNIYLEKVPYYTEYVRQYVEEKYGREALYRGGLQIYTAVNVNMQEIGREEIEKGLHDLDKRQGYRGALDHLQAHEIEAFCRKLQQDRQGDPPGQGMVVKGVVVSVDDARKMVTVRMGDALGTIKLADMRWARKVNPDVPYYAARLRKPSDALSVGDVILVKIEELKDGLDQWRLSLEQEPAAESALICMDTHTGYVKAMLGGRDFKVSRFNRAIQSRRQPGSAFKPIVYAAALEKGYTPATVIIDSPIVFKDAEQDDKWKPKNYKEQFFGPTRLREALQHSRNIVTIKILRDIGIDYTINFARRLGIQSEINQDLSIALGSSGISLLELVRAYSAFANLGELVRPIFITKIVDRNGRVLEENLPQRKAVLDPDTAYLMTNLLEGVVQHGTGRRVRALNRPVAGKTGTTNNLFDAWFMGFTPSYVTGVWVGFDEEKSLGEGETGSRAASPIWLAFMQRLLADTPVETFTIPDGIVFANIDAETGLLPIPESENTIFECFKDGTVPTEHTRRPGAISDPEEIFKLGIGE